MEEKIIEWFGLRRDSILHHVRIPKARFYEQDLVSGEIKRFIESEVDEIVILAIFNQETINIPAYVDDTVRYEEAYIIHVSLKSSKHMERIAEIVERTIPNPTILVFSYNTKVAFAVSLKRLNQQEEGKQVIDWTYRSSWFDPTAVEDMKFLGSLDVSNFSFLNLRKWYAELASCVYQSETLSLLGNFLYKKNADILEQRPLFDAYKEVSARIAQLDDEERATQHFGDRVRIHEAKLKQEARLALAKENLIRFLSTN